MLTVSEYAEKHGISRQRVHQLMREGRIKPAPVKLGPWYAIRETAKIMKPRPLTLVKRWV